MRKRPFHSYVPALLHVNSSDEEPIISRSACSENLRTGHRRISQLHIEHPCLSPLIHQVVNPSCQEKTVCRFTAIL